MIYSLILFEKRSSLTSIVCWFDSEHTFNDTVEYKNAKFYLSSRLSYKYYTSVSHRVRLEQSTRENEQFVASVWIKVDAGYFRWIGYRIEKKESRIAEWIGTLSNLWEIRRKLFRFAYCRILLNTLLNDWQISLQTYWKQTLVLKGENGFY